MANRRAEIQKAAYNMMGRQGLEAVHARTVAAEMGINHATIHYYFKTRADLLVGVCEFASKTLDNDRMSMGEAGSAKETLENEMALAEAYTRKSSRFAKVLVALCAASVGEQSLQKPVNSLVTKYASVQEKAVGEAGVKSASPFGQKTLMPATVVGLMVLSQLGHKAEPEAALDAVFNSMF